MARSNADFSRWTVLHFQQRLDPPPRRIVEIGPGPGIGLEALLGRFPRAQVCGVDRSREMLRLGDSLPSTLAQEDNRCRATSQVRRS